MLWERRVLWLRKFGKPWTQQSQVSRPRCCQLGRPSGSWWRRWSSISWFWIQKRLFRAGCILPQAGASRVSWETLLCQQMGDGGLTGNRTEPMQWLCVGSMRETRSHSLEVTLLSKQWAHLGGDWEIGSSCWQCRGRAGGEGSTSRVSWGHPLGWLLLATEFGGFCFCEFYSLLMPMYVDLDTIVTLFFSC